MSRKYIPFTDVKMNQAIIVDSIYPRGLVLAHWRGAASPPEVRGDTSADIVFNALHQNIAGLQLEYVTANHFDIDGFVGVWALLNPGLAFTYEKTLRQMALIGDFRELDLTNPDAATALKLVCWINAQEKALFYPPFGAEELEENEVTASVPKFTYFLQHFGAVLIDPEQAKEVWEVEYNQVKKDYAVINSAQTTHKKYPGIGLVVVQTPEPVHYYALFSQSAGYDIILTQYNNNRYELEYKYTTWIDLASRPTLPRISLKPLINELNNLETAPFNWTGEQVTDTGPLLRLSLGRLSKNERYANPPERKFLPSGIAPEIVEKVIIEYFKKAYAGIEPKKYWTWKEIKLVSKERLNPKT